MGTGNYFRWGTLSGNTHSLRSGHAYYDPLLFALEGGAWKHPMTDGLGSTRQLLDNTTQNVTDEYAYEAFGNLMSSSGSTPNPYRYVGALGYYQTGSSLQHLGARHYLPEVGRFLQRDSLAATPDGYAYVGHSPVLIIDPTGKIGTTIGPARPDPWDKPIPDPGRPNHPCGCHPLVHGIDTTTPIEPGTGAWRLVGVKKHWSGVAGFQETWECHWWRETHYVGRQVKKHWSIAICSDPGGGYYIDTRTTEVGGEVDYWTTETDQTTVLLNRWAGEADAVHKCRISRRH